MDSWHAGRIAMVVLLGGSTAYYQGLEQLESLSACHARACACGAFFYFF